uniref:GDSL-type esterase/lipase family protein n=1 Tax=Kitasatospora aureofaciens TaxID=1894 RepID=UPI001AE0A84D
AGHLSGGINMMPGTNGLWANFKAITAGDFTGTGKLGIAGIDANNNMMFYPGDGAGHLGTGIPMLGTSGLWAGFKAITAGDFTGTGKPSDPPSRSPHSLDHIMKRRTTLTTLAIAGLLALPLAPTVASAAVATPAAVSTTSTPSQLKILPLGDSITAGYQSSTWNGYRGPLMQQVNQQTRYTVNFLGTQFNGTMADNANEGHSGYEIQGILNNVDSYLTANRPDAVLLHIGINDLNNNDNDHATAATRAETLIDRIFTDQPGVTVIMQGLIPTTAGVPANPALQSLITSYNDQLRAWAASEVQAGKHFTFVDAPALTSAQFADGLHPNDAGYSQLAQTFYTPLDQAFTNGWVVGGAPIPYESPRPARVAAGDFNGDGKLDVVGVDANSNMQYYPGNGAGSVSGPGTPMLGTTGLWANFKAVAAGDFTGTGHTGVAGIDANNNMMFYTGDGAGHLSGGINMMPGTNGLW